MLRHAYNKAAMGIAATVFALSTLVHGSAEAQSLPQAPDSSNAVAQTQEAATSVGQSVTKPQFRPKSNHVVIDLDMQLYRNVLDFLDTNHVTGKIDLTHTEMLEAAMAEVIDYVAREKFVLKSTSSNQSSNFTFNGQYVTLDSKTGKIKQLKLRSGKVLKVEEPNLAFSSYTDQSVYLSEQFDSISAETGISKKELFRSALEGVITASRDKHTQYFSPKAFKEFMDSMSGQFAGIGTMIEKEGDYTRIQKVIEGAPAEKAGVQDGDVITHVDGQSIRGFNLPDVVSKIVGDIGSNVDLTVKRGQQTLNIAVTRDLVKIAPAEGHLIGAKKDTAYIKFTSFTRDSYKELRAECERLIKEANDAGQTDVKLVLDLRNNGGGDLGEVINIVDMFLAEDGGDRDVIVATGRTANDNKRYVDDFVPGKLNFSNVAIVQNQNSASASEILAGALRDKGFSIIGTRSYGKGSAQGLFGLDSIGKAGPDLNVSRGGGLKATVDLFFAGQTGLSNQGCGIIETHKVVYGDKRDDFSAQHKFGSQTGKNTSLIKPELTRVEQTPKKVCTLKPEYSGVLSQQTIQSLPEDFVIDVMLKNEQTGQLEKVKMFDADLAAAVYALTGQSDYLDVEDYKPDVKADQKVSMLQKPALGL